MRALMLGLSLTSGLAFAVPAAAQGAASTPMPPRFLLALDTGTAPVDVERTPVLMQRLALDFDGTTLREALNTITTRTGLRLVYNDDLIPVDAPVYLRADNITAAAALTDVLLGTGVDVVFRKGGHAALVKRPEPLEAKVAPAGAIIGRVRDAASGVGVGGASVLVEGTDFRAVTGSTGQYRIADVPAGTYSVVVQQIGYAEAGKSVTVTDGGDATVDFALEVSALPLDEIVATGTAFATRMRTVPNPISVITAQEIEQKQATNIADLLRGEIPGVMALYSGQDDFFSTLYVRGNANWTSGDYIKIYIDGVEVADPNYLSTIDPKSIDRIEVVRGPQASTIYGSEAASGVLQIFTKKGHPGLDRPRIDLQSSVGMLESDYTPSGANHPLTQDHSLQVSGGEDAFSYRAGASYGTVGEWVTGYRAETLSFSGGLRADQGPFTAELTALWSDRGLNRASSPVFWNYPVSSSCPWCGQPDLVYPNTDFGLGQNTMGLTLRYRTTERWQHTLILGDDQNRWVQRQLEPHRLTPADTFVSLGYGETRRRSIRYHTAYEATLGSAGTSRFTLGGDYWSYDTQGSRDVTNLLSAFGTVQTTSQTAASFENDRWWNAGYFGMAELGLKDRVFLTLAMRVEENPHLGEDYGRAVSPRVGASYVQDLGPADLKLRAQYGKGIRPPPSYARTGQVSSSDVYLPNPEIGPEEKVGWDAGVELHWSTGSLSVTRYDEDGKNLIQSVDIDVSSVPAIRQYQNIGRVGSEGWELEGRLDMGPVTLKANYAYSDNAIRALSNQYTSNPNSTSRVGDRMGGVPTHSGGGAVTWRLWAGSVTLNMSVMDDWRTIDYGAYYGYLYGGEPYRGTVRDYYYHYSDALWKWNLRAEQAVGEWVTAFVRVDNLANNQLTDGTNLSVSPGRTTAVGLRVGY